MAVGGHVAQLVAQPFAFWSPDAVGQHRSLCCVFSGGKDVTVVPEGSYGTLRPAVKRIKGFVLLPGFPVEIDDPCTEHRLQRLFAEEAAGPVVSSLGPAAVLVAEGLKKIDKQWQRVAQPFLRLRDVPVKSQADEADVADGGPAVGVKGAAVQLIDVEFIGTADDCRTVPDHGNDSFPLLLRQQGENPVVSQRRVNCDPPVSLII